MTLNLLSYLVRTGVVGLAALLVLFIVRHRSAANQHLVTASSLIAMLALIPGSFVFAHELKPLYETPVRVVIVAPSKAELERPSTKVAQVETRKQPLPTPSTDPVELFVRCWEIVTLILLLRLSIGVTYVALRVFRSEQVVVRPGLHVRVDAQANVPLAVWWGRPWILLPGTWNTWSPERLDTVLKHEAAHLERGDCWIQLAGSLSCAVAWPNPLAWWLGSRTRSLSEQAVDDLLVRSGVDPAEYAQDLLDIARQSQNRLAGIALPMAIKPEVSRRIEMILNTRKQRGAATLASIVAMVALFGTVAVGASRWSLVPATAATRIGRVLSAATSVNLTRYALAQRASEPEVVSSEPELIAGSDGLIGKSANSTQQAVEPMPPARIDEPYSLRAEAYVLGDITGLSKFGVRKINKNSGYTFEFPLVNLAQLRGGLLAAGSKYIGLKDLRLSSPGIATAEFKTSTKRLIAVFDTGKNTNEHLCLSYGMTNRDATNSPDTTITFKMDEGFATGVAFRGTADTDLSVLWLFIKGTAPIFKPASTDPNSEDTPNQVVLEIQHFQVPGPYQDAKMPDIGPRGDSQYQELSLDDTQLAAMKKDLETLGGKVVEAPILRTLLGFPLTMYSSTKTGESRILIKLTKDRRLLFEVTHLAGGKANYHLKADSVLPTRMTRVIVGRPDINSESRPVWIIGVQVLGPDGNPVDI